MYNNIQSMKQEIKFYMRSWKIDLFNKEKKLCNIYHACIQKTGSQWIKAVFSDSRVQKYSGLVCYPQKRYEYEGLPKKIPKYTFCPRLYIPYYLYEEIEKPEDYRTFYVIRYPRNVVISWYYSMLQTHPIMGNVSNYRTRLRSMTFEDGITYCIKRLHVKFAYLRSWMNRNDDNQLLIVKFEDMTNSPNQEFKKLFEHCKIDIPNRKFNEILEDYSKENMRKRDLARRKYKSESHYRIQSSNWKDVFTSRHEELFNTINGDLLKVLNY